MAGIQVSTILVILVVVTTDLASYAYEWEFQRYDGWYNNLAHPEWGTAGSRLYRQVPSAYSDGVYMINCSLPSARLISDLVFKGPDGIANRRNVTTMLAFFSQVVAYEIMQASDAMCPLEMQKIQVATCDPVFDAECSGKTMIPFIRARYDTNTGQGFNSPREQINARTSWIDASFLYSTQEPWLHALRSLVNGTLRDGPMPNYPPFNAQRLPLINPPPPQVHRLVDPERLFMLGDARINENPALLSFGLMLFRWHNVQAKRIKSAHPNWGDEQIFQRARRWVIATLQNIIMYEFLPALLGEPVSPYSGYNPNLPPGISHLFASAAYRYPHTLVPPGMFLRNATCHYHEDEGAGESSAIRLCNTWWNSQEVIQRYSMDAFVLGMASQIAERDDIVVVSDLRDFVFGPIHFSRRDLVALTIMRGRDNGLADYNTIRKAFRFAPVKKWSEINPKLYKQMPDMFHKLADLYGKDIDRLDFYVGGILESTGDTPGPLFTMIIREQFDRIRHADRFWFENRESGLFSEAEIREIHATKLSDIIIATTNIQRFHLQRNVFFWHDGDPCPQPYQLNSSHLEPCIPFMRYDHFMGNEVAFIYTCIVLGAIPIACIGVGYWMIKRRRKLSVSLGTRCPTNAHHNTPNTNGKVDYTNKTPGDHLESTNNLNNNNNNSANANGHGPGHGNDYLYGTVKLSKMLPIFTIEKSGISAVWVGPAIEWLHENYSRSVAVILDHRPAVHLTKRRGGLLRCVSLEQISNLVMYKSDAGFIRLELPRDYDMVLRFESYSVCEKFTAHLDEIMRQKNKQLRISYATTEKLLASAETREKRQQKLEHFFREAYAKAFRFLPMSSRHTLYDDVSESVLRTSLTRTEFAEALGMQENDLFIQRMFACVARTNGEKICFQDFLDTVIKFATGTMEEKLKIIYFLCDRDGNSLVDREEFCQFLRSIVTAAGTPLSPSDQDELIHQMLYNAGIQKQKPYLTRKDFDAILKDVTDKNKPVGLHLKGRKQAYFNNTYLAERDSVHSFSVPAVESASAAVETYRRAITWLEDYRQHVTCLLIFFLLTGAAFLERFWQYSTMSEHRDLRRVMGYGIAVTRGAAAAISFCLALILLTVCRNVITKLRETPMNQYIPFDAAIGFHKIIGVTVGFFAIIHSTGHCINFYHVSTQDLEGLSCLFQEAVFSSDFQPSITYWFFGTVTGITGILLVAVMSIMYVFAAPSVMHNAYHAFRITHCLNILLYGLTVAHGLPKLLDSPIFWKYMLGPVVVLVIEWFIAAHKSYRQLEILEASLLPSDVTYIKFKRPRNFHFRSGQWVRIRCPAFSCNFNEWHAFSLASAPQDTTLEIYAKAQGPWTWKLRHEIQAAKQLEGLYPSLHMDGPYGGGNQEWSGYEVAVMVGGGIGVTPYASILTDLVTATSSSKFSDVACKKVYFLWICPTQKNFEWFIEVLRKVEEADAAGVLETHIYITQFFHKFDLRTTMLYICEKHFRVNQGRSMFTNLKAVNHFGRPVLTDVLKHVRHQHGNVGKIGVFSCGPRTLNRSVQAACEYVNSSMMRPNFIHRYETF